MSLLNRLVTGRNAGWLVGGQGEKEGAAEGVDIRAHIRARAAGILFLGSIPRCSLMANEKEGSRSICGSLSIAQVYQDSGSIWHNANVIWFNVAVNDDGLLCMEKVDGVAYRKDPP